MTDTTDLKKLRRVKRWQLAEILWDSIIAPAELVAAESYDALLSILEQAEREIETQNNKILTLHREIDRLLRSWNEERSRP